MSKEKLIYLPVGALTTATMLSGVVLGGAASSAAEIGGADTATASVTIADACSFVETQDHTSTMQVAAGGEVSTKDESGKPSMKVTCNDPAGFSIQVAGAADTPVMVGDTAYYNYLTSGSANIPTGTSGDSYWAMQVTSASNSTLLNGFVTGVYTAVPNSDTTMLQVSGSTTGAATAEVRTDYMVHVGNAQPAGTYTGKVKYTLVH